MRIALDGPYQQRVCGEEVHERIAEPSAVTQQMGLLVNKQRENVQPRSDDNDRDIVAQIRCIPSRELRRPDQAW